MPPAELMQHVGPVGSTGNPPVKVQFLDKDGVVLKEYDLTKLPLHLRPR